MAKTNSFHKFLNAYHYFRAMKAGSEYSSLYPISVGFETTAVCNLRCPKCPVGQELVVDPKFSFMDIHLFRRLIDEIKDHVYSVSLSGYGEPLINPRLFEYVEYAKQKGLMVSFFSNGVALNDSLIANILKYNIDSIAFSIDCLPEQFQCYSKLKGIPINVAKLHLEKIIAKICDLVHARDIANNQLNICCVKMDTEGGTPLEEYQSFWQQKGVDTISGGINDFAGSLHRISQTMEFSNNKCSALYSLSVNSDGRVPLCCIDYMCKYELGDTRRQTLSEIYNGKRIREIRKIYYSKQRDNIICGQCKSPFSVPNTMPLVMATKVYLSNNVPKLRKIYKKYFRK